MVVLLRFVEGVHTYPVPPLAVSVAEVPVQTVESFAETTAVGCGVTFTIIVAVSVHPIALVAITV
jgi:hypothetical protein